MSEPIPAPNEQIELLERRIDRLRGELRRAATTGDKSQARTLRAELRRVEQAWDAALADLEHNAAVVLRSPSAPPILSIREQVHHALTLLAVPAAPKLIIAVHDAFFPGELVAARLTSLRRDEERSFKVAPYNRPYYLCPALTADLLSPARGLLAISTWPLATRVVGPLSARVDFLVAAIKVAQRVAQLPDDAHDARRLLWRFASGIPGAVGLSGGADPDTVAKQAQAELDVHLEADTADRAAAASRAQERLDGSEALFGARLQRLRKTAN
ncbi:SNF7 family protein [Dactylosporangium matsuzakiense]|uniref:Uncharacterized protein n=1 Tax=Dactylosporangium matsuzakiense TaxID=53360 RepID=A0A9W6KPS0_9ACTN|nr:SNF7 family protein [Dactylosporangium matsuzakiense]GLL05867.1 hypothetical protein GCM10017581_076150 [Dactylosporangium matsuzakiense]